MVLIAGLALAAIVLTGAAVRLSQAGLGCENWPSCSDERFVPAWAFLPWVEFGNRLISGVVAVAAAAAVLSAYRRQPRRVDLIHWAWGLVAGVVGQIVLGGITVRVELHPAFVGVHFLLSMILLWNAIVLWVRAGSGPSRGRASVPASVIYHGRALLIMASAVLVTGTLVTGTGPNSGDAKAERLNLSLTEIARVHSATVWCFTIVAVLLALRLSKLTSSEPSAVSRWLLVVVVAQGGIGYLQYALGVPAALVEVHILGSVVVWSLSVLLYLRLFARQPAEVPIDKSAEIPRSAGPAQIQAAEAVNDSPVLDTMKS